MNSLSSLFKFFFGFILCSNFEVYSTEPQQDEIKYFVIGSNRVNQHQDSSVFLGDKVDLSHRHSFGEKACTLDLQPCPLEELLHIQADATTYAFPLGIKGVYIEQFPTFRFKDDAQDDYCYLEKVLQNLTPRMKSKSILDIEWRPYGLTLVEDPADYSSKSPFHGFFDLDTTMTSAYMSFKNIKSLSNTVYKILKKQKQSKCISYEEFLEEYESSQFFNDCFEKAQQLNELIHFYSDQIKISVPILKEHLTRELEILQYMFREESVVKLKCLPSQGIPEFKAAFEKRSYEWKIIYDQLEYHKFININKTSQYYDIPAFFQATLFNYLLSDLAVIHNKAYVQSYLEQLGFENVSIERTQSPYNHRQNIWLVHAVKI